ncbi:hypothetical protein, partial [Sansalvadorimonas verongulae]|uniref:hypothetical protein n=1 Tax=Sansalvadorimonas verongulae TaxID=2172824 RepID=UPI0018AD1093
HSRINQSNKEQRRLRRLKERLANSPVIFIQGDTATGKSYSAAEVARQSGPVFVASLGPSTDERELVQRWVWKEGPGAGDRHMERLSQTLLQWAETQPVGDEYITLVLDE